MCSRNIKITNIKIHEDSVSGVQQTTECSLMIRAHQTEVLCFSANRSAVETLLLAFVMKKHFDRQL
jgi:hypothetical protein